MNQFLDKFISNSGTATRSTIVYPLMWMALFLVAGITSASYAGAPQWILAVLAMLLIAVIILFIFFYCHFAIKAPDQLRSERFTLRKMEIERGVIGDNVSGLKELPQTKHIEDDVISEEGHRL